MLEQSITRCAARAWREPNLWLIAGASQWLGISCRRPFALETVKHAFRGRGEQENSLRVECFTPCTVTVHC